MPILPAEPDIYPDDLLAFPVPRDDGSKWWVAHVRSRQDKCLSRRLHAIRIPFYAPTAPRRVRVRGRMKYSHVPLFPGYVFFRGTPEQTHAVRVLNRAVSLLAVSDPERLCNDLRQVAAVIASGRPIFPEDRFEPGTCVRVCTGALSGLRGTVIRSTGASRFVVTVDFIRRGVAIEVDGLDIEVCA